MPKYSLVWTGLDLFIVIEAKASAKSLYLFDAFHVVHGTLAHCYQHWVGIGTYVPKHLRLAQSFLLTNRRILGKAPTAILNYSRKGRGIWHCDVAYTIIT